MTGEERQYLADPYRTEFESTVIDAVALEEGKTGVYLGKTLFYPESGGQPADRGSLGGQKVIDVQETDKGVMHVVEGSLAKGDKARGKVDWKRRFDHMQQHSGQHLLSRIYLDDHGMRTIGFHLGERTCTIDLDGESITEKQCSAVERRCNELIWENIEIGDRTVTREEYEAMSAGDVRSRLPADAKDVRIVEISELDRSTCCGTHVRGTGEIGMIKILRVERVKGGPRVEFVCGARALEDYAGKHAMLSRLATRFSTDWTELERVVDKLSDENKTHRKRIDELGTELARARATELSQPATKIGEYGVVRRLFESEDAGALRETANEVRGQGKTIVLFAAAAPKPSLIFACSEDVPLDMGELLKRSAPLAGMKGGGGRDYAQGGGGSGEGLEQALDEAERMIGEMLS
jgi:alanyl-tRNA synthetase